MTETSSVVAAFGRHGMPPAVCNPDLWTFDLETGVRVASKVRNLHSKFGHLGSRIIRYVRDGRTDRQTDGQKPRLPPSLRYVGGIINYFWNAFNFCIACVFSSLKKWGTHTL